MRTVISINPTSAPIATLKRRPNPDYSKYVRSSSRLLQNVLQIVFGVRGSTRHSRRLWTFRIIIGAILMCFGLMFSSHTLRASTDALLPGISYAMILGGAMIACGLLTRIVSVALATVLIIATVHSGMISMESYAMAICAALSLMGIICGSGRYSLDTLLYNCLIPTRKPRLAPRP